MLNIVANINGRKKMEAYVDGCKLKTPEEVSRLFLEYTLLIWDYLLVGRIYDFYNDDIVMNHAGGITVQGIENVFMGTLGGVAAVASDNTTIFVDIFAEGSEAEGYHFLQATTAYRPSLNGGKAYAVAPGQVLPSAQNGKTGLCECRVEKVNGRWMITEEWLVRATGNPPKI